MPKFKVGDKVRVAEGDWADDGEEFEPFIEITSVEHKPGGYVYNFVNKPTGYVEWFSNEDMFEKLPAENWRQLFENEI